MNPLMSLKALGDDWIRYEELKRTEFGKVIVPR